MGWSQRGHLPRRERRARRAGAAPGSPAPRRRAAARSQRASIAAPSSQDARGGVVRQARPLARVVGSRRRRGPARRARARACGAPRTSVTCGARTPSARYSSGTSRARRGVTRAGQPARLSPSIAAAGRPSSKPPARSTSVGTRSSSETGVRDPPRRRIGPARARSAARGPSRRTATSCTRARARPSMSPWSDADDDDRCRPPARARPAWRGSRRRGRRRARSRRSSRAVRASTCARPRPGSGRPRPSRAARRVARRAARAASAPPAGRSRRRRSAPSRLARHLVRVVRVRERRDQQERPLGVARRVDQRAAGAERRPRRRSRSAGSRAPGPPAGRSTGRGTRAASRRSPRRQSGHPVEAGRVDVGRQPLLEAVQLVRPDEVHLAGRAPCGSRAARR